MQDLHEKYLQKKQAIEQRLKDFKDVFSKDDDEIFAELVFCICTPQSRARNAWHAVETMKNNGSLYNGSPDQMLKWMAGVRFNNNKSRHIYEVREKLKENSRIRIKDKINASDILATREWLVQNIKGYGYKEASHFLRNIGFGENIAILDRHILKHLVDHGVINKVPKSMTPKQYKEIEQKLMEFSGQVNIPPAHLDLLWWSEEAGEIFK